MFQLNGPNRFKEFKNAADELTESLAGIDGVLGVVLLGGVVRGFADRFSDLDVTVFLNEESSDIRRQALMLAQTHEKRSGIDIDLEIHVLDNFRNVDWSEIRMWDFSNSETTYDPKGVVREMLEAKLSVSEDFWIRRLSRSSQYLKWYCCPPREGVGTISESFVERGDILAALYCVNYCIEMILTALFALNRRFYPPPKWRLSYSYSLPWLPKDYRDDLKKIMIVQEISASELYRRIKKIQQMWRQIEDRMSHEFGLTDAELVRYYVQRMLGQKPA